MQNLPAIPHQGEDFPGWLKWKSRLIGGHGASTIAGVNPYQTMPQLYDRIVHGIVPRMEEKKLEFLQHCSDQEELIARRYMRKSGRKVRRTQSSYHRTDPRAIISPDRIILNDERGPGVLEIKSRGPQAYDDIVDYGAPEADWVQTQHYLDGSGYTHGVIVEGNRDNGKQQALDIDADPEFQALMWERIQDFLAVCDSGQRPTIDRPDPMLVPVSGVVVVVDETNERLLAEFAQIVHNFETSRTLSKDAEALHKENKRTFNIWMKKNNFEVCEGLGRKVSLKWQKGRKSFSKDLFAAVHPKINLDDFNVEGNAFQVARVNAPKSKAQTNLPEFLESLDPALLIGEAQL